jgi:hypothetical protein
MARKTIHLLSAGLSLARALFALRLSNHCSIAMTNQDEIIMGINKRARASRR